jgi:glutaredoxin
VVYGAIVQHIIGEGHCRRVAKIYKDKESITYSKLALKKDDEESDEALEGEEEQMQVPVLPDHDNLLLDVAGGKKNSATKQKTPNKKVGKKKATSDGNSQNTLTVHGGLVVNGVDIVTYIRGLEGRVSDLERKLAASSSETNVL